MDQQYSSIDHISHVCLNTVKFSIVILIFRDVKTRRHKFMKVMVTEDQFHWEIFSRMETPRGYEIILVVWSFKRNRFPDCCGLKNIARLCAHGGL